MRAKDTGTPRASSRAAEILLWCGAALGTMSILAALAAVIFGIVPLVFKSGSMSPEIPTGSLGLARTVPAGDLRVGDVVSVTAASGTRVTHRVVAVEEQPAVVVLSLRGDTNPSPDQEMYSVTEADRVFFSVPHLGRAIMALTSPVATFVGGLAAAALLFWAFRRRPGSDAGTEAGPQQPAEQPQNPGGRQSPRAMARTGATLLAVGLPALLVVTTNAGTSAYWTDNGKVTTTGFGVHRLLQPGPVTCTANATSITVKTTSVDTRYSYWASAYTAADGGAALGTVGKKRMSAGPPASVTINNSDFPQPLTVGTTYWLRIHSRVGATGNTGSSGWESREYRRQPFGWNGSALTCGEASPPTIAFAHPTNGSNETRQQIVDGCERGTSGYGTGDPLACGTAVDNGTVESVQYIFKRSRGGSDCWNGASWGTNCSYRAAARVAGQNRWSVPGTFNNPYVNFDRFTYTLTIKATSGDGYVSERSITFTVR